MKKYGLCVFLTLVCHFGIAGSHGDGDGGSEGTGSGAGGAGASSMGAKINDLKGDPFKKFYMQAYNKIYHNDTKAHIKKGQKRQNGQPGGLCARYVRTFLDKMGCANLGGIGPAKGYVKPLQNSGFTLLKTKKPCEAPIGAVIVYGGLGNGHIEIKTPMGYLSDYLSRGPRTSGLGPDNVISRAEFNASRAKLDNTKCLSSGDGRVVLGILMPPEGCLK